MVADFGGVDWAHDVHHDATHIATMVAAALVARGGCKSVLAAISEAPAAEGEPSLAFENI